MDGWKKLVAGALIGVAGTVYATDEEARRNLPRTARDLPDNVRRRFREAVSAGREASSTRRREILRDLEAHGGGGSADHRPRHEGREPYPHPEASPEPASGLAEEDNVPEADEPRTPALPLEPLEDATEPIDSSEDRERSREGRTEGP